MARIIRWPIVAALVVIIAVAGWSPATLFAGPVEQKGSIGPEISSFQSAAFALTGFMKVDGVTVDVSGKGVLALPNQSSGTFKVGPFTIDTVSTGSVVYVRNRFDQRWEEQDVPVDFIGNLTSIATSDVLPRGPFALQSQERVDGRLTSKWTSDLDLGIVLALAELSDSPDPSVRETLRSLKATLEVWVGNEDRQLYRERVLLTFTIPPIEPGGDPLPGTIDMTLNYTAHNQPVMIQAPVQETPRRRSTPGFPKLQSLLDAFSRG